MKLRVALGTLVLVLVAACSSGSSPTPSPTPSPDPTTVLCTTLDEYAVEVAKLYALDPSTATVEQYQAQYDAVAAKYTEVVDAAEPVARERIDAFNQAYDQFKSALENLPSGATGNDAAAALAPYQDQIRVAYFDLRVLVCDPRKSMSTEAPSPSPS